MSLFNKLFGGKKQQKKNVPPPPPPLSDKATKQIQAQKILHTVTQQINKMDDETNKLENQAEIKAAKAKEYMAANKKKEAKNAVGQLAEIKKKIENINIRKKVLRTQRNQVEAQMADLDVADSMTSAVEFMKANEDLNQKLQEMMLDTQQIQANMQQTNRIMKDIANTNMEAEDQADELFRQLQQQANQQKADKIAQNLNKNTGQTLNPIQVQKVPAAKVSVEDDLSKWLN